MYFHPLPNIWTLRSRGKGDCGTVDREPDSSSPPGASTLCPAEKAGVCRPGQGGEGVGWDGGNDDDWRKAAHQYPVMAAWESYCYRNAAITQARQVYCLVIHSCWKTTGEKLTRLPIISQREKLWNNQWTWTIVDRNRDAYCMLAFLSAPQSLISWRLMLFKGN